MLALQYVTTQIEMLDQMDPWEYQQIRVVLGHGSGFDSPGFRRVPKVTQRLWRAFDRLREAAGLELSDLYRHGREHEDLYQVAELLTEWDERIWLWRFRHYTIVARALGEDTIGTPGDARAGARQADRPAPAAEAVGDPQPAGRAVRRRARAAG